MCRHITLNAGYQCSIVREGVMASRGWQISVKTKFSRLCILAGEQHPALQEHHDGGQHQHDGQPGYHVFQNFKRTNFFVLVFRHVFRLSEGVGSLPAAMPIAQGTLPQWQPQGEMCRFIDKSQYLMNDQFFDMRFHVF